MRPWLTKTRGMIFALTLAAFTAQAADTRPVAQSDVLAYLDQLMEWQRAAMAIDPAMNNARERIFRDSLQQNATHVLQSGFTFARTEAVLLAHDTPDALAAEGSDVPATPHQKLRQRMVQTDAQMEALTRQLAGLKHRTGAAAARQRQEAGDQLKLLSARRELLQAVLTNVNAATSEGTKGLLNKIENLARSIPELNPDSVKPSNKTTPPDADTAAARSSSTILGLASIVFDITRKQTELNDFMAQTSQLETTSRALMKPLRDALDGPNPPSAETKEGADQPAAPQLTIDQRVAAYKQMGAAILPLGEANLWVGISKRTVNGWQDVLDHELQTYSRRLGIRLAILAFTLAIPLAVSTMARRAIKRYVIDPKRKRQLNTARRIVAALVVLMILLLTFISDFSSFATFAGFMTAGLAVALQSVLLALVAHFLFYGRYGVRAGDRVNVSGVMGEIMQIGMVRFYMRELRDDGKGGVEPTGKLVAFPNSILFQPSGFYKYVEGK